MIQENFDDRTLANMEVALNRACQKLSGEEDTHDVRRFIGERIVQCAVSGSDNLTELTEAAMKALTDYRSGKPGGG
jgi:hypothetical protein